MKEMMNKLKFAEIFCLYVFTSCMLFFFYIMYKSFSTKVDLPNEVDQIMIAIIGITGSVVGYVVGSSKSSADKDKTIAEGMKPKTEELKTN